MLSSTLSSLAIAILSLSSQTISTALASPVSSSEAEQPRKLNLDDVVIQFSSSSEPLEDLRSQGIEPTTAISNRDDIVIVSVKSLIDAHGIRRYVVGYEILKEQIPMTQARIVWAQKDIRCSFTGDEGNYRAEIGETIVFGADLDKRVSESHEGDNIHILHCRSEIIGVYDGLSG